MYVYIWIYSVFSVCNSFLSHLNFGTSMKTCYFFPEAQLFLCSSCSMHCYLKEDFFEFGNNIYIFMYFISFHHYKCKYTIQRLLEIYFVLNIFWDSLGNSYLSLRGSQCLTPFLYLLIYKENSLSINYFSAVQ